MTPVPFSLSNHDAAETWGFYTRLKADLGFDATYTIAAIAPSVVANSPDELIQASAGRLNWFLEPMAPPTFGKRITRAESHVTDVVFPRSVPQRLAIDAYYERAEAVDQRRSGLILEPPTPGIPESLDFAFELLQT